MLGNDTRSLNLTRSEIGIVGINIYNHSRGLFYFKEKKIIIKVRALRGGVGNLFYAYYLFTGALGWEVRLFKQSDGDLSARLSVAQILLALLVIILLVIYYNSSKGLFFCHGP